VSFNFHAWGSPGLVISVAITGPGVIARNRWSTASAGGGVGFNELLRGNSKLMQQLENLSDFVTAASPPTWFW
jgi:hypothetical protein